MDNLTGSASRVATPLKAWAPRFVFVLLVGVAFALMLLGRSDAVLVERARTAVADMVSPILDIISRPVDSVGDAISTAEELANLRAQNAALKENNERLLSWQGVARRLESENAALRNLSNLVPDPELRYVSARVIGDPGGTFVRAVLVNAGSRHGVVKGQAAVNGEGLAGRIAEVGSRSARVLLVTDMNSRIPVLVGEGRDRAILGGDNSDLANLLYLGPTAQVRPGDRVVTSGHGGVFPPGIAVGFVTEAGESGARVQPFVDWDHMEYLRLVDYELPGLLKELDTPKEARAER